MEQTTMRLAGARDFLQQHPLGVLATVNDNGHPECSAVYAKFEDDLSGYFVSKEHTRKFRNITKHPNITLYFVDEEKTMCGEVSGIAEVIEEPAEAAQALAKMQTVLTEQRQRYWVPPIAQLNAGSYALCKIMPSYIRVIDYSAKKLSDKVDPLIFEILLSKK